jgi:hydrogenase nickel incorporation protein HypA/HybF
MHEAGLTQNILDLALGKAREVKASRVGSIDLVIGELSGAAGDSVRFYFEHLSRGTPAEGAVLNIREVPAQLRCRDCGRDFHPEDVSAWLCPGCGSLGVEVTGGRELLIESMEVD